MIYFGKTDIGKKRQGNQDNFGIYPLADNAVLCIVCDGMGGAAGGKEASALALDAFSQSIKEVCSPHSKDGEIDFSSINIKLMLENAAEAANAKVFSAAKEDKDLDGMGTTLVALLVLDGGKRAFSVNVGDSRMYQIDKTGIKQLTHDHSYVQFLVDMGKLTPEEARNSTNRNIITRAIGTDTKTDADISSIDLSNAESGLSFLLCSDGLTNMVSDTEIESVIKKEKTPEKKVESLIEKANRNGGQDNITAVILEL